MKNSNDNFLDETDMLLKRASEMFPPAVKKNSGTIIFVLCIAIFFGMILALGKPINHTTTWKNVHVGDLSIVNHTAGNPIQLRQWGELSYNEKKALKIEVAIKFPQVNDIGQGVEWSPITKWLAEEKGVIASNIRDAFRDER